MGVLKFLRETGAPWLGAKFAKLTGADQLLTREKIRSQIGGGESVMGRVWFLPWIDTASGETAEMRAAYRVMVKDPTVKAALFSKIFAVGSLDLTVEPDGIGPLAKRNAKWVRHSLTNAIGGVPGIVSSILTGGLLHGVSVCEPVWRYIDRGEFQGNAGLKAMRAKDPDWYRLDTDEFSQIAGVTSTRAGLRERYPADAFVIWQHLPIYENPLGMSDLRAAYRAYWLIDAAWKWRGRHLEKFTSPMMLGRYADVTDKPALDDALALAKAQTWLTVPLEAQVEALELSQRGTADFDSAIADLKHEVMLGITGAILQALEGNKTGARSIGEVHQSSAELIVWYLATSIANVLNHQHVPDTIDLNYTAGGYPLVGLSGVNDADLAGSAAIDDMLLRNRLKLSKKEAYKRYGRSEPEDDNDVWEVIPQPAMPFSDDPKTIAAVGPLANAPGVAARLPFALPTPRGGGVGVEKAAKSGEVALVGKDGAQASKLLRASVNEGTKLLHEIASAAVARLLKDSDPTGAKSLFNDEELQKLTDSLAATNATGELLGRSRIQLRAQKVKQFSEGRGVRLFCEDETPMVELFCGGKGGKPGPCPTGVHDGGGDGGARDDGWAKEKFAHLNETLSDAEKGALRSYAGGDTQQVNMHLRALRADAVPEVKATVGHMDAAIAKSVMPETLTVFRGMSKDADASWFKKGETTTSNTFTSATMDKNIAEGEYTKAHGATTHGKTAGVLEITVPKGANALPMNAVGASPNPHHQEVLLPRNAKLKIISRTKDKDTGLYRIKAEVVHDASTHSDFADFAESITPLPPEQAIDYFTGLVPSIGVDPKRFGPRMERDAFTLANQTDRVVLDKVQAAIRSALETGELGTGAQAVQSILNATGLAPVGPQSQYSEMVFRTNVMDSYNTGASREIADMEDTFPAWKYLGVRDGRQGEDHEPHFDLYYPASLAFADVRGDRVFNCRCTFAPIDFVEWEELKSRGAKFAA